MYKSIAEYYEQIFPLSSAKKDFILSEFAETKYKTLLDIGCATGELTNSISSNFKEIWGIDNDKKMISIADKRNKSNNIKYNVGDILQLNKTVKDIKFDGIICIGNTLVHINSLANIKLAVKNMYDILNRHGKIIVQIVNYDRILNKDIVELPDKDTNLLSFKRKYIYDNDKTGNIKFHTILSIKDTKKTIENNIILYPLNYDILNSIFKETGFQKIKYYGNYIKETYNKNDSQGLIVIAEK